MDGFKKSKLTMQKNLLYLSWPAAMFGNSSSQKVTFCSQVETCFTSWETATSSCTTDCFLSSSDGIQDVCISMPSETSKVKYYGTCNDFSTVLGGGFSKSKTDNTNTNNINITTKSKLVHIHTCIHVYMHTCIHAYIHNFILFQIKIS